MKGDLIVPIYVDTNALLDLLASIEGGFSIVEKVTTHTTAVERSDGSVSTEIGTEFGIPNVLNLLKIRLSGSLRSARQRETGEEVASDRYHTYGSLLYRLRGLLDDGSLIKRPYGDSNVWETIEASDFVEVRGVFRPNPLVDSLEQIDRLIGLFEIVSGPDILPQRQQSVQKREVNEFRQQMKQFRQFIKGILADIEKGSTRLFVVEQATKDECSTVVLLFKDYLRDPSMAEIAHKEYRLLGKVVRKIDETSGESIELLHGTALGGIGKVQFNQLFGTFNQLEGMNLPEIKSGIKGPALEVVPIAVYV